MLVEILDAALEKYKNYVPATTRMTPFELSSDNKPIPILIPSMVKLPKVQVGDYVRVPYTRNWYTEGFTTNWKREFLKIHKTNSTNPVTYVLEVENTEQIEGKYYDRELLGRVFKFISSTY